VAADRVECGQRRVATLAIGLGALLCATTAGAEEENRALTSLQGPPALAARGPSQDEQQRERLVRGGGAFGARAVRAPDQALLTAARSARWAEALQLLKSGQADANTRDAIGGHPLVLAARAGQDELVRELLRRGTDTDRVGEDGFTALGAAAFAGHRSTVRLMLRAGVDARRWGSTGHSPLHLAAIAGQVAVLNELLQAGVSIEVLNRSRESALDVAAAAGQQEAMDTLIKAGANLELAGRR
jgi:hypothetical protein